MARKVLRCVFEFENYIAHPYWPECDRVISIDLHSGVNRLKIEHKKLAALKGQCQKEGITLDAYDAMIESSKRQWYRVDDKDQTSPIIIPRHQLAGCLVETVGRTPKAIRGKYEKDSFRALVQLSDFRTDRTDGDGVYARFVKLDGSTKRSWQENEFIGGYLGEGSPFTATGTAAVEPTAKVDDLKRLFAYAVEEIGLGASRKMGFGRGRVVELTEA